MRQPEIHHFLERYFIANGCEIIEQTDYQLAVQLTVELDKLLMNRPFYWHYLKKTGGVPQPMRLSLITDHHQAPPKTEGEQIYFGSPRLHHIFQSTKKLGGFIRLYEASPSQGKKKQTALYPWLGLNLKVSYICDQKKDVLLSVGLQLIHGQMITDFHTRLLGISLTPKIPDYSFTISPLIMPKSGLLRIENYLRKKLEAEEHTWAIKARERWQKDRKLLEHFYEDVEEKGESYENEKMALKEQYEPKISVSIVNGGLFYLTENACLDRRATEMERH